MHLKVRHNIKKLILSTIRYRMRLYRKVGIVKTGQVNSKTLQVNSKLINTIKLKVS